MSTSTSRKSETARLFKQAAKELELTGAATPAAIRKIVARAVQAGLAQLPAGRRQDYVVSIAKGFDDALASVTAASAKFVNPRKKVPPIVVRGGAPVARADSRAAAGSERRPEAKATPTKPGSARTHRVSMFEQAMTARAKLAVEGKLLTPAQFVERSGVSRQAINQQIQTGSLFTVDGPQGVSYYPAFFVDADYERRAVRRVARALDDLPGASKWAFFTSPRLSLGGLTPLEVIAGAKPRQRDGAGAEASSRIDMSTVLKAAAAYVAE
ncbi:hypothetical protein M0D69_07905 [Caballeronia sp. SEWSISQ10-4 2]|uniref:hypothetical protein n=1 Tax=Caballeronia sp. SEWSISQ10-4 2 TaxID=2937438 RepID=UPI00264EA9B7|nr:hypothetical protein [Caballeronia sp. SEWSISQ10-4 2]MDN7177941.1 hypothetical protein [Caballeronia sp. SEWSISQ10-4 2]